MQYSEEMRERMSDTAKGKEVKSLKWEEEGKYWVMEFSDGTEMRFRLWEAENWL